MISPWKQAEIRTLLPRRWAQQSVYRSPTNQSDQASDHVVDETSEIPSPHR